MNINSSTFEHGQTITIKVNGELVDGFYDGWHEDWNMPWVKLPNGKRVARKPYAAAGVPLVKKLGASGAANAQPVRQSRFAINQRFGFIENLVDMVISGESKSVIISGSGGLGKTYTVMARLKEAGLESVEDVEADEDEGATASGDYEVIKGYSTPKSLYRLLYNNRDKIIVFDDCDSVWDNPTSVSLLKAALDSYEERWISWLSEIKGDDEELPQRFKFEGKVIFVSNLTLSELDQAVLSRCLYVDVSMTPAEKIERIRGISTAIRPELSQKQKDESLELLAEHADKIGDLNIRTFMKVLEIRHKGASNWRDLAEYVITAL
jgi:hypothetical protein